MDARCIGPLGPPKPGMDLARIIAHSGDSNGRFSLGEVMVRRGNEPPLHRHQREDVLIYVVAGHLTVQVDHQRFAAGPGASVMVPKGSEHGYAIGSDVAHLLVILTPAGAEASLADLYGSAATTGAVSGDGSGVAIDRLVTTAARLGIDITGPPLGRGTR